MATFVPFLLFSTEQDAKDFIKSGSCPKTPHGESYRIVKSRVERCAEPLVSIPKAFKNIDIRTLPANAKNRPDSIKSLDLHNLNKSIATRLCNSSSSLDLSKAKGHDFSQLVNKTNEVLKDFIAIADFFTLKDKGITGEYVASANINTIPDKNNKEIIAVQYNSPVSVKLSAILPIKNKSCFL